MASSPPQPAVAAWIVAPAQPDALEVWGLTPVERLRRSLAQAGCAPVRVLDAGAPAPPGPPGPAVVIRADWIYDDRLVAALAGGAERLLLAPDGARPVAACAGPERLDAALAALRDETIAPPAGLRACRPHELVPAYTAKLRKAAPPYLLPASPERRAEIEATLFSASYKGATDLVTKWVWPRPARAVTRRLAVAGVHPNAVTLASWALAVAAFGCFWTGAFGPGLVAAWAMTFLDTVDGKLARVTLTSSRLGDVLDHGLDLIHPPLWWWAWGVGLGWGGHPVTLVVVGGYFAGRALEGIFLASFKMETHSWRPIDTLFRTITARRNPNLILLSVGTLAGRPDLGLVLVAIWTLISLAFHAVRLMQAFAARGRGEGIAPWDGSAGAGLRPLRAVSPGGGEA